MTTTPLRPLHQAGPVELLRTLDANEIRRRLSDLDAERRALLVLLRAALAASRTRTA